MPVKSKKTSSGKKKVYKKTTKTYKGKSVYTRGGKLYICSRSKLSGKKVFRRIKSSTITASKKGRKGASA